MNSIVTFILAGLSITLLDIDNAMYSTGQISSLGPRRRLVLILSLLLEFIARLGLLALFALLSNETEPLFYVLGFPVTLESLSLFTAGAYLLISNSRELAATLQEKKEAQEAPRFMQSNRPMSRLLFEMTIVLTVMSIDTMLAISGMTNELGMALYLLLFSAILRLLFVERIVHFVELYPAVQVFILILLIFIGTELILQGLGLEGEVYFNIAFIAALLVYIIYRRRKARQGSGSS